MEKIKKTGASCWFKKDFKRESVKDKLYRWRMNVKYIYQRAKYGLFGEKLKTEEDKEREKKTSSHIVYMLGDAPEYKEISDKYFDEYKAIENYRDECKDKAFALFSKWFWHLWD